MPLSLSEYRTHESPFLAANLRRANIVSSVDKASTNSKLIAPMTPQVNSRTQNFLSGESQVYTGPAGPRPVTANGVAWLTLTLGKGLIGCPRATVSYLWHDIQSFLTRIATCTRLSPTIQNVFLRAEIMAETPPCFMRTCWNMVNKRANWEYGRIIKCFSSQDKDEWCNRPWTRRRPSSAITGVSFPIEIHMRTEWPCLRATNSLAYGCSWMHWINRLELIVSQITNRLISLSHSHVTHKPLCPCNHKNGLG